MEKDGYVMHVHFEKQVEISLTVKEWFLVLRALDKPEQEAGAETVRNKMRTMLVQAGAVSKNRWYKFDA